MSNITIIIYIGNGNIGHKNQTSYQNSGIKEGKEKYKTESYANEIIKPVIMEQIIRFEICSGYKVNKKKTRTLMLEATKEE